MSGVLDRMVKQARGVLPTVQPLTAPRHAPAVGARRQILAETAAPSEARENSGRTMDARPIEVREFVDQIEQHSQADNEGALSGRNSSQPPMRTRVEGKRNRSKSQDPDERGDNRQSRETVPHSETPTLETSSARQSDETAFKGTQELTVRVESNKPREHEEGKSPAAESRSLKNDEVDVESAARTTPATLTLMESAERAMEVRIAARMERAAQDREAQERAAKVRLAQAEPSQAAAEQRTEINISIGSIELRAPHVEAKPRQAPFRPQVTLDDFLRRKPEAGA